MVDEQKVSPGTHHARHFRVEPARIWHNARGEHGNRDVKGRILEGHVLGVHFNQTAHMGKLIFGHTFMGLGQHLPRQVNANHL